MKFIQICLTALVFSSFSISAVADPDASFFNGYPIYPCDTAQSSCLSVVSNKVNAIIRKGGNPYNYAYAANTQTAQLTKYSVITIFERGDRIAFASLVPTDSYAASKWEGVETSFTALINAIPGNLEVNQVAAVSSDASPPFLAVVKQLTQLLVAPAFAQAANTCPDTDFDGTIETASAADFVASSALRKQAFNNLNIVQTALAGFVGAFEMLAENAEFTYGKKSGSLSVGSFTPPPAVQMTFFDGSSVNLRVDLAAMTFTTDNGTIFDCNGNRYEEDQELDEGAAYNFDSEKSFQDFMAYHGQSSTNLDKLPKFAYYRCWTPSPGTVRCEKKWR